MEINDFLKNNNLLRPMMFLVLFLLIISGLGGCGGWSIKFTTPVVPPAPCPIEDLLLDVSEFPGNDWEETGSRSVRGAPVMMGIGRIGTAFSTTNGGATQEVYRFEDERKARRALINDTASWFIPSAYETEWETPKELENLTITPREYRIGCNDNKHGGSEQCQYVAQYGPYVIVFFAHMRALTYGNFINLVNEIDQRATRCLGS